MMHTKFQGKTSSFDLQKTFLAYMTMVIIIYHETWPRGYKVFFMLNSVGHEILNAHKYKNIKKFCLF